MSVQLNSSMILSFNAILSAFNFVLTLLDIFLSIFTDNNFAFNSLSDEFSYLIIKFFNSLISGFELSFPVDWEKLDLLSWDSFK